MAQMIPRTLKDLPNVTSGEKKVFSALSNLPKEWYVWFNMGIANTEIYPDFIVLDPDNGILVLEVKDWSVDNITEFSKDRFSIKTSSGIRSEKNPIIRVRNYTETVLKVLQKNEILIHRSGDYQGKMTFLWDYACVFPNITKEEFESKKYNDVSMAEVISTDKIIFKEYIKSDPDYIKDRIQSLFSHIFKPKRLTKAQFYVIRQAICPETVILGRSLMLEHEDKNIRIDATLDAPQEALAKSIGEGHRLLHGIAGSGKTLIMLFRAKLVSRLHPEWKIIFLCWNISLGSYLRQMFHNIQMQGDFKNVQIFHFAEWVRELYGSKGWHVPTFTGEDGDNNLKEAVRHLLNEKPSVKFHTIFVDEAQDFEGDFLKLVVHHLDPKTNNLLICADEAQNIMKRTWKSLGINLDKKDSIINLAHQLDIEDGYSLETNYRNTREIISFAAEFYQKKLPVRTITDGINYVERIGASKRTGPQPQVEAFDHPDDEWYTVARWILDKRAEFGLNYGDFLVVFPGYKHKAHEYAVSIFGQHNIPYYLVSDSYESKKTMDLLKDTVKISTIASAKGMDFPAVAFIHSHEAVDRISGGPDIAQLYTACTRARDLLLVTYNNKTKFKNLFMMKN